MQSVLDRFRAIRWSYADKDTDAGDEMRRRIANAARHNKLIYYSDLVSGVLFRLPNVANGEPFHIDTTDWSDLDRAILGDYLGYLSLESYERHGFFASALVVSKTDDMPSDGFWNLMKLLELVKNPKSDKALYFWSDEVKKAREWYLANPDRDV
jgi:hypothetical protein